MHFFGYARSPNFCNYWVCSGEVRPKNIQIRLQIFNVSEATSSGSSLCFGRVSHSIAFPSSAEVWAYGVPLICKALPMHISPTTGRPLPIDMP